MAESEDVDLGSPSAEPIPLAAVDPPLNKSGKRPRLDLDATGLGTRERKRGKSIFGLVLGTLNQAKNEDKKRGSSDAAKNRALIEQRLQSQLRNETNAVRKAEDAKKDRTSANRKEEDLQLKDSLFKLRRKRLPLLANFLLTSDDFAIPNDDEESTAMPDVDAPITKNGITKDPLAPAPRSHPPPLYYLPAILTPSQEAFIKRRKEQVAPAIEAEWSAFKEERAVGVEEVRVLREKVASELEEAKIKASANEERKEKKKAEIAAEKKESEDMMAVESIEQNSAAVNSEVAMAVEDEGKGEEKGTADDDDVVEY